MNGLSRIEQLTLPESLASMMREKIIAACSCSENMDDEDRIATADTISRECLHKTHRFEKKYFSIKHDQSIDGAFIKNIPGYHGKLEREFNILVLLVMGAAFGMPFQYKEQHNGKLITILQPKDKSRSNTNSTREVFQAHTDDAYIKPNFRARYIGLLGERNSCSAKTGYSSISTIIQLLPKVYLDKLYSPLFQFRIPYSFENSGISKWSDSRPILYLDKQGSVSVQCAVYNTRIICDDYLAIKAFEAFSLIINATCRWLVVLPKTLFVFKNDKGLHQRSKIVGDRSILRVYWSDDIKPIQHKTNESGCIFSLNKLMK